MSGSRLLELPHLFDDLRKEDDYEGYTEEEILQVLEDLNLYPSNSGIADFRDIPNSINFGNGTVNSEMGKVDSVLFEDVFHPCESNERLLGEYNTMEDVPSRVVNEIFSKISNGKLKKLNPNYEQEILDYFESLQLKGTMDLNMIAKGLRYVLRPDITDKSALVVIDVQNDFISGTLALKNAPAGEDGEEVVDIINGLIEQHQFDATVYSFDWHPEEHCSFASNIGKYKDSVTEDSPCSADVATVLSTVIFNFEKAQEQVLWPDHCTQESEGAQLHENLKVVDDAIYIYKGQSCHIDSYSAFWDNGKLSQTDMLRNLLEKDITKVYVCGLAYDYCVGSTAVDAAEHGFETYVIRDATRGVANETIDAMEKKLKKVGVFTISSDKVDLNK